MQDCRSKQGTSEHLWALFIRFSGNMEETKSTSSGALTYVTPDTDKFYLSREVLKDLGVIDHNFPQLKPSMVSAGLEECSRKNDQETKLAPCGCLTRAQPPPRPERLPFEGTVDNIPRMRQWLLDRYASSTFNKCLHQTLPLMGGRGGAIAPPIVFK